MDKNEQVATVNFEHIVNEEIYRGGCLLINEHVKTITILRDSSFGDREEVTIKVNGKEIHGWIVDK